MAHPLYDANFGDVGASYDPWIFLAYVAAHTDQIALGTAVLLRLSSSASRSEVSSFHGQNIKTALLIGGCDSRPLMGQFLLVEPGTESETPVKLPQNIEDEHNGH